MRPEAPKNLAKALAWVGRLRISTLRRRLVSQSVSAVRWHFLCLHLSLHGDDGVPGAKLNPLAHSTEYSKVENAFAGLFYSPSVVLNRVDRHCRQLAIIDGIPWPV